jgi:hypothetical protein
LLGGVDDDADLLEPQRPARERLAGRGVLLGQQPRDPQPTGGLGAGGAGEPGDPGVGAGLGGGLGDLAAVGLGAERQPQRRGPGLDRGQHRHSARQRLLSQSLGQDLGRGAQSCDHLGQAQLCTADGSRGGLTRRRRRRKLQ